MQKESSALSPAWRHSEILKELENGDLLNVNELSKKLGVSLVTIRKDLDFLDSQGQLKRIHGGATRLDERSSIQRLNNRMSINKTVKKRIAVAVADQISNGDAVILNSGSTMCYIAEQLRSKKDIIVITNSFNVFSIIANYRNIVTLILGGRYDPEHQISYDEDAIEQLSKYKADKLIVGMDGVDLIAGATTYTHTSTAITKKMLSCAKKKIIAADSSKIGKTALVHIAPLTEFDMLVTNQDPATDFYLNSICQQGVEVLRV